MTAEERNGAISRAGNRCQARTPVCPGDVVPCGLDNALVVHHIQGRVTKKGVERWEHRPENLLVCHSVDHVWIHGHPTASYEAGWMKRKNSVEAEDES